MLSRRVALVALATASLLAGAPSQSSAGEAAHIKAVDAGDPGAGHPGASQENPPTTAEGAAEKAGDSGAQKPAEGAAQSPAEDGAQKPAAGNVQKPADGNAQKSDDGAPKTRLVSILGREVTNRDGDGGRIIDVLVDLDGRSGGAAVVEFGGFMGIGSRKVAVEWSALRFVREGNRSQLVIDVSREQIRDTPEYKPNEPPVVLTTK